MHSDLRESWTCPYCCETFHVITGRNHERDHAPHCPNLLPVDSSSDRPAPPAR